MAQYGSLILKAAAVVVIIAFAVLAGLTLFLAVANSGLYLDAMLYYNIAWFVGALLAFCCALTVVPNSLAIFTAMCAGLSFIMVCLWDTSLTVRYPVVTRLIEMLPAWLFILTWGIITISAFRSKKPNVKLSGWAWLAVFSLLAAAWMGCIAGKWVVVQNRNGFIQQANEQIIQIGEQLGAYFDEHGAYPESLEAANISKTLTELPGTSKKIKYYLQGDSYTLTFEDPLPCENITFCYDTSQGRWQPEDPYDTLDRCPRHMFLGYLRK